MICLMLCFPDACLGQMLIVPCQQVGKVGVRRGHLLLLCSLSHYAANVCSCDETFFAFLI